MHSETRGQWRIHNTQDRLIDILWFFPSVSRIRRNDFTTSLRANHDPCNHPSGRSLLIRISPTPVNTQNTPIKHIASVPKITTTNRPIILSRFIDPMLMLNSNMLRTARFDHLWSRSMMDQELTPSGLEHLSCITQRRLTHEVKTAMDKQLYLAIRHITYVWSWRISVWRRY